MGYNMSQRDARFVIKAEHKAPALAAIKALADRSAPLMWVLKGELRAAVTLEVALAEWGWEVTEDEAGDIVTIQFIMEKAGDEQKLFAAIAPFVEARSYIEMSGEDGDRWRWCFDGQRMTTKQARIVWEE